MSVGGTGGRSRNYCIPGSAPWDAVEKISSDAASRGLEGRWVGCPVAGALSFCAWQHIRCARPRSGGARQLALASMQALTYHGPGKVRCETVPDPAIEAATDVVVRVGLTAICGSDLHVWRGHEVGLDPGTVLGHEFLGEVVEVGGEVRGVAVGDQVVAPFTTSCGRCFYCRRGLTCRCTSGQLFGWVEGGAGLHGAQAEFARVPLADATLVGVPAGASPEEVLLCGDVLSTGMFCAEAGDVRAGAVVAVIGCGPVGLMAVVAARELGAERVFACDPVDGRRQLAERFGAESLSPDAALDGLRAATGGRGADSVLEAVGHPSATRLALDLVRPGGTVAACGVHTEASFAFAPGEAYDKNLTYRAGRCPARHYLERALAVVQSGKYQLGAVYSHRWAAGGGSARLRDLRSQARRVHQGPAGALSGVSLPAHSPAPARPAPRPAAARPTPGPGSPPSDHPCVAARPSAVLTVT